MDDLSQAILVWREKYDTSDLQSRAFQFSSKRRLGRVVQEKFVPELGAYRRTDLKTGGRRAGSAEALPIPTNADLKNWRLDVQRLGKMLTRSLVFVFDP